MDWRKLNSSHPLYDLALWRSLETYSDLSYDEVFEDSSVQDLDVRFGSGGYTVRPREFHGEARSIFMRGMCILFALALYETINKNNKFVMWTSRGSNEESGWNGHVALQLDDEHVIDFCGVKKISEMDEFFTSFGMPMKDRQPVVLSFEELVENHVDEAYQSSPFSFVDDLEAELTRDFARELVKEVNRARVSVCAHHLLKIFHNSV